MKIYRRWLFAVLAILGSAAIAQQTRILSFENDFLMSWENTFSNSVITVEFTTDLPAAPFTPALNVLTTGTTSQAIIPIPEEDMAFYRLRELDSSGTPEKMGIVPGGWYRIGGPVGSTTEPERVIYVDDFLVDECEVTKAYWDEVRLWGTTNGYNFINEGLSPDGGKTNHPVQTINWYDAVKWCNARSEKEGLVPAYYTSPSTTMVYRTGELNLSNDWVRWEANGYRLPTEAEWEKAARGGLGSQRFPWGSVLNTNDANYFNSFDPFDNGTTPVAFYAPNGYGVYDVAGNVGEWVWDWYQAFSPPAFSSNSMGPVTGTERVTRGGGWESVESELQCGDRSHRFIASHTDDIYGFRTVRKLLPIPAGAPPVVTTVVPDFGARLGGTRVRLIGTGFSADTTVKFGSSDATVVTFVDAQTLEVIAPISPTGNFGTFDITVANPSPPPGFDTGAAVVAVGFSYTAVSAEQPPYRNPSRGWDRNDNPAGGASINNLGYTRVEGLLGGLLLHSGEFTLTRVDLAVRGRGLGFAFRRTYRSGADGDGPLGHGWDANVFRRLEELPNENVLHFDGTGRVDEYARVSATAFDSPAGHYTQLSQDGGGAFTLRGRHGGKDFYDVDGLLTAVEDRRGNRFEFTYNAGGLLVTVVDVFGRSYTLVYDGNDRLTTVSDFAGRSVVFTYDGAGNLIEARSPLVIGTPHGNDFPNGRRERYGYDTGAADPRLVHNLLSVIAPNEVEDGTLTPRILNTYGAAGDTLDRVVSQQVGGTNASGTAAGGTLSLAYDFAPVGAPAGTVRKTRVTDRRGNLADYFHDAADQCLEYVEDPGGVTPFTWSYTHNAEGERTGMVLPLSNQVVSVYDSANADRFQQGNLLSVTRLPDAARGGDQAQLVTSYSHEPLFNQVLTMTGPRGNDATYVPQNGGVQSAARYTTRHFYDWQEAAAPPAEAAAFGITIPPALLSLGDLNDDGRTDQAMGNLVRREDPSVTLLAGSNQAVLEGDTDQEIVWRYNWNDFGQPIQNEGPRGNLDTFAYFPENDPDGDSLDLIVGADPTTGGYLEETVEDAAVGPRRQDTATPVALTRILTLDRRGNPLTRTDPNSNVWQMTFNALDETVQTETPKVDASQANGYLRQRHYDANGNVIQTDVENVTMDTNSVPLLVAAHPFFIHIVIHDILDNLIETTRDATRDAAIPASAHPEQLTTRFVLDANENVVRVDSPLAVAGTEPDNAVATAFDARDLATAVTRGVGSAQASTWNTGHDANGNPVSMTDAVNDDVTPGPETEQTFHDGFDRVVRRLDRAGNERQRILDPGGRVVHTEAFGPVDGTSVVAVKLASADFLFDEVGRLFQADRDLFLPMGAVVSHGQTRVDGALTPLDNKVSRRREHDALARLTFVVDDHGFVTGFEYDGADRRIRVVLPLEDAISLVKNDIVNTFDFNGNLVQRVSTHVDPRGITPARVLTSYFAYNAVNRSIRDSDAGRQTRYRDHDSRGLLVTSFDSRGKSAFPDPIIGNLRGNPVRHRYDGAGRRWQTIRELHLSGSGNNAIDTSNPANPDGLITLGTEFNANSRVVSRSDDLGNTTSYGFDVLNRSTSRTLADGAVQTLTRDADHRVVSMVDENNTTHSLDHDALDRLVERSLVNDPAKLIAGGTLPMLVGTTLQSFEYDGLSRLTRATDNNNPADAGDDATLGFVYDSLSRLVEEVQNTRAVGSSYTGLDRTDLHYPGAGRVVHHAFDSLHQVTNIANFGAVSVDWDRQGEYGTIGKNITGGPVLTPPDLSFVCGFDDNGCPNDKQISNSSSGSVAQFGGFYDNNWQTGGFASYPLLGIGGSFGVDLNSSPMSTRFIFQFFPAPPAGVLGTILTRGPDGAGNTVVEEDSSASTITTGSVNNVNELEEVCCPGGTPDQYHHGSSPSTGIRTRDPKHVYQWDAMNRLRVVRVATNPVQVIAEYDYEAGPYNTVGRRIEKRVQNSGALDGTTRYLYDQENVIEERQVTGIVERVDRQFIHGLEVDEPLVMDVDTDADGDPDTLFFYVQDIAGDVNVLTDDAGIPVEHYLYPPLKAPIFLDGTGTVVAASANANPYLLKARRFDPETGLYYNRARYLDYENGIFLSRDPMGQWFDHSAVGNGYSYAGNRPMYGRDPSGLATMVELSIMLAKLEALNALAIPNFLRTKIRIHAAGVGGENSFSPIRLTPLGPPESARASIKEKFTLGNIGWVEGDGRIRGQYNEVQMPPGLSTNPEIPSPRKRRIAWPTPRGPTPYSTQFLSPQAPPPEEPEEPCPCKEDELTLEELYKLVYFLVSDAPGLMNPSADIWDFNNPFDPKPPPPSSTFMFR